MGFSTAIVAIVAIIMLGILIKGRQNALNGNVAHQQDNPTGPSPREEELESEVEELRERVKVLERIATDGNETARLSSEIDKLRDK